MTTVGTQNRRRRAVFGCLLALMATGCAGRRAVPPVVIGNPRAAAMTIAVAPALNFSGSADFDANRFADLMASELSAVEGVSVIPVSRVLGVLAAQGMDKVSSPGHALELVEALGADAILVFAVNEYDPYDPPSIGISAQLYGAWPRTRDRSLDPVALSRRAGLAKDEARRPRRGVLAESQRVFNASHGAVADDVRRFARLRKGDDSPYGWRKYLVSQRHYIRYCCHAMIRDLFSGPCDSTIAHQKANGTDAHERDSAGIAGQR